MLCTTRDHIVVERKNIPRYRYETLVRVRTLRRGSDKLRRDDSAWCLLGESCGTHANDIARAMLSTWRTCQYQSIIAGDVYRGYVRVFTTSDVYCDAIRTVALVISRYADLPLRQAELAQHALTHASHAESVRRVERTALRALHEPANQLLSHNLRVRAGLSVADWIG